MRHAVAYMKKLIELNLGGPAGAQYSRSKSGWMESANFEQWFKTAFIPYVRERHAKEDTVYLIYDGHNSHMTYHTGKFIVY